MASTGSYLRELRERHGVSLEELAHTTRIGPRFLRALEEDDFGALPAGPFAKGFIRSYCQALSESAEEPLALYAAAAPASAPRREVAAPPRKKRSLAPVLISLALLVILGAALAAVTLALRSGRGDGSALRAITPVGGGGDSRGTERPTPRVPPAAVPPGPTASAPATSPSTASTAPPPASAVETPVRLAVPSGPDRRLPSTTATGAPYRLVARAADPTWIRVRMEGGRTIEETIPAGEVREWISNHPFELRIGNAGGVSLELNGQVLPPLGARGAVIMRLVVPAEPQ